MDTEKFLNETMKELGITETIQENTQKKKPRSKKQDVEAVESITAEDEEYRSQLMKLVASGRSEELLGKKMTFTDVEKFKSSEVKKYYNLYTSNLANKINSSIVTGCVNLFSKLINKALPIDDVNKLADELRNDYVLQSELQNISGIMSLKFGRTMAIISAGLITLKHTAFTRKNKEIELVTKSDSEK